MNYFNPADTNLQLHEIFNLHITYGKSEIGLDILPSSAQAQPKLKESLNAELTFRSILGTKV